MNNIVKFPLLVFALSFAVLWLSTLVGDSLRKWLRPLEEEERHDFGVIQAATLTLLGPHYRIHLFDGRQQVDQRKNYEAADANAIGTEYVRADMLSAADTARVRELLKNYLDQRLRFYKTRDVGQLRQIDTYTAQLQNELWSTVRVRAAAQPTPVVALAVSGMNDVLNSQGYTRAAWWNRIPVAAWVLLATIAIGCNLLIGYGAHRTYRLLFLVLPLAVSVSFFLIADIDSPRGGLIHVQPQNLEILYQTLYPH
jgi:hypothetical protein